MRVSKLTPSYDPIETHFDQIYTLENGSFWEYGSRTLNKHDCRLLFVLFSQLPKTLVSLTGRALKPKQKYPDFLSLRVGSNRTKLIELSLEQTAIIRIDEKRGIRVKKEKKMYDDFLNELPSLSCEASSKQVIKVNAGTLHLS